MKSAFMGDTWYLMGRLGDGSRIDQVYSVSLPCLMSHINNKNKKSWNNLSFIGLYYSTPVCMRESLSAIGGRKLGK